MTLLMRDQENMEKGLEKGLEKGILGMIASLRKFGVSENSILQELEEKFTLSEPEAKDYMIKSETWSVSKKAIRKMLTGNPHVISNGNRILVDRQQLLEYLDKDRG